MSEVLAITVDQGERRDCHATDFQNALLAWDFVWPFKFHSTEIQQLATLLFSSWSLQPNTNKLINVHATKKLSTQQLYVNFGTK